MFPQGLSPEAQAAIAQVQATGGQNVDAYGDPIGIGENTNQAGGWARTSGMWDVPAKAQSMAAPRVTDFQTNVVDRRSPTVSTQPTPSLTDRYTNWWDTVVRPNTGGRMPEGVQDFMRENPYFTPMIKEHGLRGVKALADKIGLGGGQDEMATIPEVVRASESAPRETWGGDLKLTMPQDPITRGWIQDPATILNIGNLIKKMGGTIDYMKGIDDRIKENRDRRFRMFQGDPYSPVRKY
jgi:hypothetical protein